MVLLLRAARDSFLVGTSSYVIDRSARPGPHVMDRWADDKIMSMNESPQRCKLGWLDIKISAIHAGS